MITLAHQARFTARPTKNHGPTETKNGNPRYEIEFEMYEDGKPSGVTCAYNGPLDGEWGDKTLGVIKTCGGKGDDINALTLDYAADVQVKIKEREYNGRTLFEVQFVDPARRALDPSKSASFTDRLRAALGTAPTQPAPAKPVAKPAAKTPWSGGATGSVEPVRPEGPWGAR